MEIRDEFQSSDMFAIGIQIEISKQIPQSSSFLYFFASNVIVVLGIIAGFSLTYWAKSNDKWCFAKPDTKPDYNQAPTSDPDIVKTKKEDTVKEEKEKSDKVVDNPV